MIPSVRAARWAAVTVVLLTMVVLAHPTAAGATLSAPQEFEVTSSSSTIQLDWNVVGDPRVGGYFVYYNTTGPEPPYNGTGADQGDSPVRVTGANNTSLLLTGLQDETRYYFVITAYDQLFTPGDSTQPRPGALCDVLNPAAPTDLAGALGIDGVHLSWTPNHEVDAWGAIVYRGTTPEPSDSIAFVVLPLSSYFERRPGVNQRFYYRLRAIDFCRLPSPLSDTVSLMIPDTLPQFTRGDVDASGELNISDPIYNLNYQFDGGPAPPCLKAADDDDNGEIDVSDPIYSLNYQFSNGPPEPAPFPNCGVDPTPDTLSCLSFPPCGTPPLPGAPPVPTNGSEVLILGDARPDSDTVSYTIGMQTGSPLLGFEGTLSYPADALTFLRLDRTDASQSWDFLSARCDPAHGTIHFGAVPDLHMHHPISPAGDAVFTAVFRVNSQPGNGVELLAGQFVASSLQSILPNLQQNTSSAPGPGSSRLRVANGVPTLMAPNPYRAGTAMKLSGGAIGQANEVSLFSVNGRRLRVLYRGVVDGYQKSLAWDGHADDGMPVRAGVYYLRASFGPRTLSRKILFLP